MGYWICYDEAAERVEGDAKAVFAFVSGPAASHETPKGTPAQRAEWARTWYLSPHRASLVGQFVFGAANCTRVSTISVTGSRHAHGASADVDAATGWLTTGNDHVDRNRGRGRSPRSVPATSRLLSGSQNKPRTT